MKTKREIVKWLESKKNAAISQVKVERREKREAYFKQRDIEIRLNETVEAIYAKYREAYAICEKWIAETDQRSDMKQVTGWYGNMLRTLDVDKSSIRSSLLRHFDEDSTELRAIDRADEDTCHKISVNYNNVIANVNSAKNNKVAIEYLRELGFDVAYLEEAATVSTELTVPVDTRWLFNGKKEVETA